MISIVLVNHARRPGPWSASCSATSKPCYPASCWPGKSQTTAAWRWTLGMASWPSRPTRFHPAREIQARKQASPLTPPAHQPARWLAWPWRRVLQKPRTNPAYS